MIGHSLAEVIYSFLTHMGQGPFFFQTRNPEALFILGWVGVQQGEYSFIIYGIVEFISCLDWLPLRESHESYKKYMLWDGIHFFGLLVS